MSSPLSLIAYKCAPHVFDISSGLTYASIRDQLVRGRLVANDIGRNALYSHVLVVGAGVAGTSAAVLLAEHGVRVTLVDVNPRPFELFRGVRHRIVDPMMYEWPYECSALHRYPPQRPAHVFGVASPSLPKWGSTEPMTAHACRSQLLQWWRQWRRDSPASSRLKCHFGVDPASVQAAVREFVRFPPKGREWHNKAVLTKHSKRRQANVGVTVELGAVLLAGGMGAEQTTLGSVQCVPFWSKVDPCAHQSSRHVGVLGGGDGALQEVLRMLTVDSHPLTTVTSFEARIKAAKHQLRTVQLQSRAASTWAPPGVRIDVDEATKSIADRLAHDSRLRASLQSRMRRSRGQVSLVFDGEHIGNAYMLNRFLVYLIEACQMRGWPDGNPTMRLEIHRNFRVATAARAGTGYLVKSQTGRALRFDDVIVRFGLSGESPAAKILGLRDFGDRISFGRIPLPYVVV